MCSRPSRGSTVRGSEVVDKTISKLLNTLGGTNTSVCNSVRRNRGCISTVDNRPKGNLQHTLKNIDKMMHSLKNGTEVSYKRVTGRPRTLSVRDKAQLAIKKIDRLVLSLSKQETASECVRAVGATPSHLEKIRTPNTPPKPPRFTEIARDESETAKSCTNRLGSIQTLTKPEAVIECVRDDNTVSKSFVCRLEGIKKPKTITKLQTNVERSIADKESSKSSLHRPERTHTSAQPHSVIERIRRFEEITKPCPRRVQGIQTETTLSKSKSCVSYDDESIPTPNISRLEEMSQKDMPQNSVVDMEVYSKSEPDNVQDRTFGIPSTSKILSWSCSVGVLALAGVFVFSGLFSPPSPTLVQRALDVSISVLYPFVNLL